MLYAIVYDDLILTDMYFFWGKFAVAEGAGVFLRAILI